MEVLTSHLIRVLSGTAWAGCSLLLCSLSHTTPSQPPDLKSEGGCCPGHLVSQDSLYTAKTCQNISEHAKTIRNDSPLPIGPIRPVSCLSLCCVCLPACLPAWPQVWYPCAVGPFVFVLGAKSIRRVSDW